MGEKYQKLVFLYGFLKSQPFWLDGGCSEEIEFDLPDNAKIIQAAGYTYSSF